MKRSITRSAPAFARADSESGIRRGPRDPDGGGGPVPPVRAGGRAGRCGPDRIFREPDPAPGRRAQHLEPSAGPQLAQACPRNSVQLPPVVRLPPGPGSLAPVAEPRAPIRPPEPLGSTDSAKRPATQWHPELLWCRAGPGLGRRVGPGRAPCRLRLAAGLIFLIGKYPLLAALIFLTWPQQLTFGHGLCTGIWQQLELT